MSCAKGNMGSTIGSAICRNRFAMPVFDKNNDIILINQFFCIFLPVDILL